MTDIIATLIEDALRARRISSRQAASEMGMSHTTLNRIRRGESYDLETAKMISRWLGVSTTNVLNADDVGANGLSAKVAAILETEPALAIAFTAAVDRVMNGDMTLDGFKELIRYTTYRLELKPEHEVILHGSTVQLRDD